MRHRIAAPTTKKTITTDMPSRGEPEIWVIAATDSGEAVSPDGIRKMRTRPVSRSTSTSQAIAAYAPRFL